MTRDDQHNSDPSVNAARIVREATASGESTPSRKRDWRRSIVNALGIAFYAGLGWCASSLLPAINKTPLERAQGTVVLVLIGTAFGLLRAHWRDLVGPEEPNERPAP
jgi:hypothetical protein